MTGAEWLAAYRQERARYLRYLRRWRKPDDELDRETARYIRSLLRFSREGKGT